MRCFPSLFKTKRLLNKAVETVAPSPRASVAVAASLQSYLGVSTYTPVHLNDDQNYPIVKMVQLHCDEYPGQVVFREDTMLDLDLLQRHSGKRFRRMTRTKYRRVLIDARLNVIPPIPAITKMRTWVDTAVDDLDYVLIDITGNREYMVVAKATLMEWLTELPRVDVTMPIQKINPMSGAIEQDRDQINGAIRKLTKLRIKRRLVDTLELPPLPDVARQLIELRSNPYRTLGELVYIIETDPTITANVLRWANSSMYADAGRINSMSDAVGRVLGYDITMNLLMGLVLGRVMKIPDHQTTHVLGFWEQAIWVAHATQSLSELLPDRLKVPKGIAYLTGLLHNFGYLVLNHAFPPHFKLITESTDINRHMDVSLVDAHILGITREQVGAELLSNWMVCDEVVYGVRYQKTVDYNDLLPYANLIYLARSALINHGVLLGASYSVPGSLYKHLGITPEAVDGRIESLLEQRDRIITMVKLM